MLLWTLLLFSSSASSSSSSSSSSSRVGVLGGGQLDWLLSERGPFHRCPEYTEFRDRFLQSFSTRYKIYRYVCVCMCVCVCNIV